MAGKGNDTKVRRSVASLDDSWHDTLRPIGTLLVDIFHYIGLFLIGAATVWAAGWSFVEMFRHQPHTSIDDLLLLFIFLEIGAMVGIYFKTNHMPVRFLIYVAITAVTRHLITFVNHPTTPGPELLIVSGTILLLALALLCIRYASYSFPTEPRRPASFSTDTDPTVISGRDGNDAGDHRRAGSPSSIAAS